MQKQTDIQHIFLNITEKGKVCFNTHKQKHVRTTTEVNKAGKSMLNIGLIITLSLSLITAFFKNPIQTKFTG